MKRRIRCRFCGWETPAWFAKKTGGKATPESAYHRLRQHVMKEHPVEFNKIQSHMASSALQAVNF